MLLHLLLNWNYSVFWKYEPSVMFLSCWSFVAIKVELNTGPIRWVHSISFGAPFLCWSVSVSVQQLPKNCESLFQLVPVSLAYMKYETAWGETISFERGEHNIHIILSFYDNVRNILFNHHNHHHHHVNLLVCSQLPYACLAKVQSRPWTNISTGVQSSHSTPSNY